MPYHVSKAKFAELVERALAELPDPFAERLEEIPVEIRARPTRAMLRKLGMEPDELLMGLYEGVDLTRRSVEHSGVLPGVIYIFQEDIELVCETEEQLLDEVRITVLHEVGHHFGLNEDDLNRLGYG